MLGGLPLLLLLATISTANAWGPTVTVDPSRREQAIEGFGGFGPARPWWVEGPFFDRSWLDKLDDLGVTIVRTQLYWDFERADGTFALGPTSDNGKQIAYLRELRRRGIKILATAWTPPVWMKRDTDDKLAAFCHGQCGGSLAAGHYRDFAQLLVEYVEQMRAAGVEIYAVSFANEPLFANPFESCTYTERTYAKVLKIVGSAFARAGLTTRLYGPEHMANADWNERFFERLLDDPQAAQYLDFYAVHGYVDGKTGDPISATEWTKLDERVHGAGKELWLTETSDFDHQGWDKALLTAKSLYRGLRFGKVSAWLHWYLADDVMGPAPQNAPTSLYYALKQFYRYIRPGYAQLVSTSDDADVLPLAFGCENDLTIILINDGVSSKSVALNLTGETLPSFRLYRTSRGENAARVEAIVGGVVSLPPQSISTLVATSGGSGSGDGGVTSTGVRLGLPVCASGPDGSHRARRPDPSPPAAHQSRLILICAGALAAGLLLLWVLRLRLKAPS
jgi:O-glycosyl hydrolase